MSTSTAPTLDATVVGLDQPGATAVGIAGAKAANLALARRAGLPTLPGVVLTTSWTPAHRAAAVRAWHEVSDGGALPVVVRSSSTGEDGGDSSMAGVFESILDVEGEAAFLRAVDEVHRSATRAREAGLVDAAMAVLVQPMLRPVWGGVLFGADPLTGRRDRVVVAAVPGGPDQLVSGAVDGWTAVLDRRGRVVERRSVGDPPRPPSALLRRLVALARDAGRAFGTPQDVEWAMDAAGTLHLLQSRPITTLPPTTGTVYGPGPVAESFPDALSTLEQDLWLDPLRDGLREALLMTGTSPTRALRDTPLVVAVDGLAAVDLGVLGLDAPAGGLLRKLDPRPPARRLRAAWRVGRLRAALADLSFDVVEQIDAELAEVPSPADLRDDELLAVLRNGRRSLVSLHGHEALVGLLIPDADAAAVTGAAMALDALGRARAAGLGVDDLVAHEPVVLALVPPRIGAGADVFADLLAGAPDVPVADDVAPDRAAVAREALRLRTRWLQELMARAAWELGTRLVARGALGSAGDVRHLHLDDLDAAVRRRVAIQPVAPAAATHRSLPARFRLDDDGRAWAAPSPARRRRRRGSADAAAAASSGAVGAGGGTVTAPVHVYEPSGSGTGAQDVPAGSVLVVPHLDPRLAAVIPRLGGLVAETGSALSHLAILARERGVPIVVGVAGATARFADGQLVTVDGHAGTVVAVASPDGDGASIDPDHRALVAPELVEVAA